MTSSEEVRHLRAALARIAEPLAFYVATSRIDPEAFARMIFAEAILNDHTLEAAEEKAESDTRRRYPLR